MKTKKSIKIIFALCLIASAIMAQPNTGQTTYGHSITGATLTAGTYVSGDPGFIMAGCRVASSPDLIVDKVGVDGLYAALPGEFLANYSVTTGGSSCNMSQTVAANCSGVSIIETFQGSTQYAMAAGYDVGCLIVFLDNTGAVTSSKFFPYSPSSAIYSKPLITESVASSGNYYIVGSYWRNSREYMYVIYTDLSFSSGWTAEYDLGSGTTFTPRGIIESTYNVGAGELMVVGKLDLNTGNAYDGFMIALDNNTNGAVNFAYRYHMGNSNDWLSSIDLATNNGGFIVGGYTDFSIYGETAWMGNLDNNGGYGSAWWKIIQFNSIGTAGDIVSVRQRYNTSAVYEYYGLAETGGAGMLVCKLDASGSVFSPSSEFYYNGSGIDESVSLSLNNVSSDVNEGLHVFGNTNNSPNEFILQQACFNGASGNLTTAYQTTTNLNYSYGAGTQSVTLGLNVSQGLSPCSNFSITPAVHNIFTNQPTGYLVGTWPASGPGPYNGNNNKTISFSGLKEEVEAKSLEINTYPNPADNRLKLTASVNPSGNYSIEIVNSLGQVLYQNNASSIGKDKIELELDLEALNLQDGLYILTIRSGSKTNEARFVVNHGG